MSSLEFPLAQGWTKGLTVLFLNQKDSALFSLENSFHLKQVHGNRVYELGNQDRPGQKIVAEADGLLTHPENLFGKSLVIKTADCVPLIFIEREKKLIAAIHAGWRGLYQKLHLWPFDSGRFNPKTTWVWLGPSLNGESFEVEHDMWNHFDLKTQSDTLFFSPHPTLSHKKFFWPWRFIEAEYAKLGVELLYNVEINTGTDLEWASYRRYQKENLPKAQNMSIVSFV